MQCACVYIHGKSGYVRPSAGVSALFTSARLLVGEGVKKKGSFLLSELHPAPLLRRLRRTDEAKAAGVVDIAGPAFLLLRG